MKKKLLYVMMLLLVLLQLTGCGTQKAEQEKKIVLKVGTDASYAPFGFQDEQSKAYVGFDIDIIQAIARKEGFEAEIRNLNFDGLIPALQVGDIDIAISDMTITEDRAEKVSFSESYYKAGLGLVVQKENNAIHSYEDLAGKTIGVSIGSTGAEEAHKIANAKIREFNTIADAFLELQNGGVDVVINDTPVNEYYVLNKGAAFSKTLPVQLHEEDLGIAVKKNNQELCSKINDGLQAIKKSGEYTEIYKKWFGKEPPKE